MGVGSIMIGYYLYKRGKKVLTRETVEMKSSDLALTPLMLAERDREHLKQCRRNRDAEAELMKGVEGWTVGTYYGMPIYKTVKKDEWVQPSAGEFYVHCSPGEQEKFAVHTQDLKFD